MENDMLVIRLVKYAAIAAISGTVGFLIGGGELPDLGGRPQDLVAQARDAADTLDGNGDSTTGALNYVRDRVAEGARRVAEFLDK
jgi:hypothetical protein